MSFYLLDFIFLIFEETATKSVTLVEGSLPPTTKCKNPNNFSKYFQKRKCNKTKKVWKLCIRTMQWNTLALLMLLTYSMMIVHKLSGPWRPGYFNCEFVSETHFSKRIFVHFHFQYHPQCTAAVLFSPQRISGPFSSKATKLMFDAEAFILFEYLFHVFSSPLEILINVGLSIYSMFCSLCGDLDK